MWNCPSSSELSVIPRLYATENIPLRDKIVHMKFFFGGSTWYIIEYDGVDLFFGFAILNGDYEMAEFGYVSFEELRDVRVGPFEVDRDLYWHPRPVSAVPDIMRCLS